MKNKFLPLVLLAMTLPVAAVADDVSFTSTGGTFSGTSQGYVLTDAILTGITGLGANIDSGADLGTVSFATAKLGSISNVIIGGPITPGGTLTISSNGAGGISAGALFTGTFSQGGTWGFVLQSDGTHLYTLTTNVTGQTANGSIESGLMRFTINTGIGIFPGYTSASGTSNTTIAVPEPEELGMVGMSLLGFAGIVRRRLIR